MMKWIPTTQETPKQGQNVLVQTILFTDEGDLIAQARHAKYVNEKFTARAGYYLYVPFWCPIPDPPPKGEPSNWNNGETPPENEQEVIAHYDPSTETYPMLPVTGFVNWIDNKWQSVIGANIKVLYWLPIPTFMPIPNDYLGILE